MKGKVLYASRENCRGVIFEIAIHVTQKVFPRHSFYAAIANNISFLFWQQKPLMYIRAGRLFQTAHVDSHLFICLVFLRLIRQSTEIFVLVQNRKTCTFLSEKFYFSKLRVLKSRLQKLQAFSYL